MTAPGAFGPGTAESGSGATGTAAPPLRIVVADDQASVREGLAIMLDLLPDLSVVATAADGEQALDAVAEHRPDAILLDLHMPVLDGIAATRRLTAEHPDVAVVVLTTYADDASVLDTLRAGARAYLTKDADRLHIARTLHSAVTGYAVLDPQVQAALLAAAARPVEPAPAVPRAAGLPDHLTAREAEVLALVARGLSNAEISAALFLSGNTVKTHINRIFGKTGCRDRVAAANYARRHGLDDPGRA
ncbi:MULTISPECIES: response regulator transcription factor [unclassified Streptomyces]|uniref:response regulator transcription factor n=1 Tax=unclassified Streptomyces TaxID=2593676 RepID=UPI000DB9A730|nr:MULTISPECIES: response regulator transcription factor [unclassified Streptomyces]MYU05706.1 response regulator [Streptomyces sp. SID8366]MYU65840.1 response regulator [Streptomyces sp. SID69]RAJ63756.1 LuxR family two component transcriptional regulator [Streptomyces sp. PsTaAH-130]